jgi:hypothetical protein
MTMLEQREHVPCHDRLAGSNFSPNELRADFASAFTCARILRFPIACELRRGQRAGPQKRVHHGVDVSIQRADET